MKIKTTLLTMLAVLVLNGCAKNQPDITVLNVPKFDMEYKTCTNQYSPLDILPYGIVIAGVAELLYTCEDFTEYEESEEINQRLEDRV